MLRELTSFFVAALSILYVWQVFLLATDPTSYASYLVLLRNPAVILFSVIALGFALYHSLTWFHLIGRVVPVKVGQRTSTPFQALAVNIVLMLAVSYAVVTILLGA